MWVTPKKEEMRPAKKMRVITVDDKRRGEVLARHYHWRCLKDDPRHRDAVRLIGPTSEMGAMTVAYLAQEKSM